MSAIAILRQLTVRSGVSGKTASRWDCFRVADQSGLARVCFNKVINKVIE
jgi:hypothetical protein